MVRRIALCACVTCLVASSGWADEPAPTSDSPQFVEAGYLQPPLPVLSVEATSLGTAADSLGASHRPQALRHGKKVTRFTWLTGEDPPPPPPRAVLTVETWESPLSKLRDRISRLPDVEVGLPQSEEEFLVQRRWTHMPAFEIVEEPLPPLMLLSHPPVCQATSQAAPLVPSAVRTRYETVPAAAVATDSVTPYPDTASPPSPAAELSTLNLPSPSADPVAMVVELFEKLKASEQRVADVRAQLAQAEKDLAALRAADPQPSSTPSEAMVHLEVRFFEIDLDGIAQAEIDMPGICPDELSQAGLFALSAGGALECRHLSAAAQGPAAMECDCPNCTQTAVGVAAQGPSATSGTVGAPVARSEYISALLSQLETAGLVDYISRPQVMARSGQAARIQVGQEIPFRQTSVTESGASSSHIAFCRAGIEVDVKPRVVADGKVQIELRAERASVDERALARTGEPAISRQSIETTLEITAGKTAVVAGLIYEQKSTATKAAPVPGKDRVFAPLGTEARKTTQRREFVVLVTPKVIPSITRADGDETRQ